MMTIDTNDIVQCCLYDLMNFSVSINAAKSKQEKKNLTKFMTFYLLDCEKKHKGIAFKAKNIFKKMNDDERREFYTKFGELFNSPKEVKDGSSY